MSTVQFRILCDVMSEFIVRLVNLLEGFRECASLTLPSSMQREGGTFRVANKQFDRNADDLYT